MNDEIKEIKTIGRLLDYVETEAKAKELIDYITNLQQKVEQYENPEDLTLFYMWLDEKAKDKMKDLQQENESWRRVATKNFNDAEDYKSRIDKVIEYVNKISSEPNVFGHYAIEGNCKKWLLNILKGDNND